MKICILTPAFNSARHLEKSIQSVLGQNDPDAEHIVVDGGSEDGTVEILKKYSHLKWVSGPDQGQSDAMNKAYALSTGDIITYLNADDWFEPGIFAHVRQLFFEHSEADLVVGNLYMRYADSSRVRLVVPAKTYRKILLYFRNDFPFNPVSYFYRRRVQDRVGSFPLHLHYSMDYWFLLNAFMNFRVLGSDLVFGNFLLTGSNKSCHEAPSDTAWQVATQHLREQNPKLRTWFYTQWLFHHWVRELPERAREPFRLLAYKALFSSVLEYGEYRKLGFRRAYRERFPGR